MAGIRVCLTVGYLINLIISLTFRTRKPRKKKRKKRKRKRKKKRRKKLRSVSYAPSNFMHWRSLDFVFLRSTAM